MIITDELREWVRNHVAELNIGGVNERDLKEISDRIDEQHRKALEKVAAMVDEPDELDKLKCHLDGLDKISAECRFNIVALERRIERIERLLSHKTGKLAGNDFGAVFLDELGQEEPGGADVPADD